MKSETEEERGTNNPAFTFTQTNAATPHRLQPFQHLFSACGAVWWSSSGATRVCRRCDESGSEFRDWEQHQPAGQQVVLPCALACATETNLSLSAHHGPMSSLLPVRKSFYTKWWNVPEPKVSKSLTKKKSYFVLKSSDSSLLSFLSSVQHTHTTTGFRCDCFIASTCFLPQVSSNKRHTLDIRQFTNNIEKMPIILSSPSSVWNTSNVTFVLLGFFDQMQINEIKCKPKHL